MPPPPADEARRPNPRGAALFAGEGGVSSGGMTGRVVEFAEELRGEGLKIGTSELLDALAALPEVDWRRPGPFREALSATLAKSPEDRAIFELVFDRFFFRAAEVAALENRIGEAGGGMDEAGAELRREGAVDEALSRLWWDAHVGGPAALGVLVATMGTAHLVGGTNFAAFSPAGAVGNSRDRSAV